jgi:glycosyltransferase involved in cell wall biosynthesis
MRLLFFKRELSWPRTSGHDVHTAELMRALALLGHEVSFMAAARPQPLAIDRLDLARCWTIDDAAANLELPAFEPSGVQARFFSYWGVPPRAAATLASAAAAWEVDAVVAVGLDALPYLSAVTAAVRVWYAADEWMLHHLSQLRPLDRRTWSNVKPALLKGLYERAFARTTDQVWVVSEQDRRAIRWVMNRPAPLVANGVDTEVFRPMPVAAQPLTAVFWGRLDFGPNVQSLEWFVREVWRPVRAARPAAQFTIIGFCPGPEVQALGREPGVTVLSDVPDLREPVCRHAVVVLPMVSGAGIKNKLLEAAAMARPILCTRRATHGLHAQGDVPLVIARSARQWRHALLALWDEPHKAIGLGGRARDWVVREHSWERAADDALAALGVGAPARREVA